MSESSNTAAITALGSGSRGNAFVVQYGKTAIMIDGGFSARELLRRLELLGIDPAIIRAMLLTHDHDDHVRGCRVFCDKLNIPLCVSGRTAEYLRPRRKLPEKVLEFAPGETFKLDAFQVLPFQVRHDAIDPVGFRLHCGGFHIGIATDIGLLTLLAQQRLHDCDALVLESNYDQQMLLNSQRSISLKRRIMGRNGHMNNVDAVAALEQLLTHRTKVLFLTHVSSECNRYSLVRELGAAKLRELCREDIHFSVIEQDTPQPPVTLAAAVPEKKPGKRTPPVTVVRDPVQLDLFDPPAVRVAK
ncbi:MBL fold metallo-hydrolase [Victivallis sp. Marseille-Q1083]|uniref:MBL fold metallo-hydrolase n=1 Tax=Victivallis sp. Marseille-Q1083 TaxID=2717288 RepID=UPI00158A35CD|nr:MBL fold metallo-hydrolase [Victivallis sp. Marseille-Q1083]